MLTRKSLQFGLKNTGEHGNYSNASAGYAGTNNAQGIKSRWWHFKRDTALQVGGAGTNMYIYLRVFMLSMLNCRIGRVNQWVLQTLKKSDIFAGKFRYEYKEVQKIDC